MSEVNIMRRLVKEAHIPIVVLADICGCSHTCIANYINGKTLPNGTKSVAIKEGLEKYKELINDIILE